MIREIDPKFSQFHNAKDKSKAALARAITGLHGAWKSQYVDFSLPTDSKSSQMTEAIISPLSPETQSLVEKMRTDGYVVYETTGISPNALEQAGMKYWFKNEKLGDYTSPPALVAFRPEPSRLFLPGSKEIPYEEQIKLIPHEQKKVDEAYPGAGLVVREGTEWPEIAWKHFQATGERLFGSEFEFAFTWMPIYESDNPAARRAIAGRWPGRDGFDVRFNPRDFVNRRLGLASLVEIPRS